MKTLDLPDGEQNYVQARDVGIVGGVDVLDDGSPATMTERTSSARRGRRRGPACSEGVLMIEHVRERREAARRLALNALTLRSEREGEIHTIALAGELDLSCAARVQRELERVEAGDAMTIVLDLSELTFLDSTGLRLVMGAAARSRADGVERLVLLRGSSDVQRVFEICGVERLLPFAARDASRARDASKIRR